MVMMEAMVVVMEVGGEGTGGGDDGSDGGC